MINAKVVAASVCDREQVLCRASDKAHTPAPTLPKEARLPINHCNLPAVILGGLTFQRHPVPLHLDSVAELHADMFRHLDRLDAADARAQTFRDYLTVQFRLENLEEAGLNAHSKRRAKANWIRMLRGWSFDADSREGAVLKGWVESRFGLLPRFHGEPLRDHGDIAWRRYEEMRSQGLYGTNALEAQLDLLYTYAQYEFVRGAAGSHRKLYRGANRLADHEVLAQKGAQQIVLFNNLTSFTTSRERAGEFGDLIFEVEVPLPKVFFHCRLLPGVLGGEEEHLVIGGAYAVTVHRF
ncbi:MAG: NAD(+)--dinitrogen-reductase ADP-D-ribosyltransferase [Georgfuchsia sp.]